MIGENPDEELVRGALAGDQRSQRLLVERHREAVYRLARNATGDAEEAFDIAQEAFVAAFSALKSYDLERPFRAWIMGITLNKCRDWARRQRLRRFLGLAMPEGAENWIADDAALPDDIAVGRAELAAMSRAIAALPPKLKDVVLLRTVENMTQAETAAALNIAEKAVENRLYRARNALKEKMRDADNRRV